MNLQLIDPDPDPQVLAAGQTGGNVQWTLRIPYGIRHRAIRKMVRTPLDDGGAYHRRQLNTSYSPNTQSFARRQDLREWQIVWDGMKGDEALALKQLYNDAYGGAVLIDFPPPSEETSDVADTVPVFIVSDSLTVRRDSAGKYFARITLRESI